MTGILCAQVAEVISPVADSIAVELVRLRSLEAKGVTVRTLSAQGESMDSATAAIPPDLLVPPTPHPRTAPTPKPLASAGAPDTKDEHLGPHVAMDGTWEQSGAPAPAHGHMLEPPSLQGSGPGRRSPSPSRILPQPQGTPVSTSVAKAMAREAAQRVAESSRVRLGFSSLAPVCAGGCSEHWRPGAAWPGREGCHVASLYPWTAFSARSRWNQNVFSVREYGPTYPEKMPLFQPGSAQTAGCEQPPPRLWAVSRV